MPASYSESESWRLMVLRSQPLPAWLSDHPQSDVVLSSRIRFMRNLRGHRFPHHAEPEELRSIFSEILKATQHIRTESPRWEEDFPPARGEFHLMRDLSPAEREYLVGCRMVSPDFQWRAEGRGVMLDQHRLTSVMINEEDHLRLQTLTPGWSIQDALTIAGDTLRSIEEHLQFAYSDRIGYLSSSPYNCGEGIRVSGMFHLLGLAQSKRLPDVVQALSSNHVVTRGLFGETSRAVGAFLQVSIIHSNLPQFIGAADYLIEQERIARLELSTDQVYQKATQAVKFAISSKKLSMAHAFRVLSWIRWGAAVGLPGFPPSPRIVDHWLTIIELRGKASEEEAQLDRADFFRQHISLL